MNIRTLNNINLTPPKLTPSEVTSFLTSLNLPTKQVKQIVKKQAKVKIPQVPIIDNDPLPSETDMEYLRGEY